MKTMTCNQLGGACDVEFTADTFDEIAKLAQNHGMEMMSDPAHMEAMKKIQALMQDPAKMQEWFDARQKEFDELPEQ